VKTRKLFLVLIVASGSFAGNALADNRYNFDFLASGYDVGGTLTYAMMFAALGLILGSYHLVASLTGTKAPWDPDATTIVD
jgi:hypothetical protein